MPSKIVLVFESGPSGWQETFYNNRDFGPAALSFAHSFAIQRAKLVGAGCTLVAARVSPAVLPPAPAAQIAEIITGDMINGFTNDISTAEANRADTVQTAVLCNAYTAAGNRRQVWLSGIRDDWVFRRPFNVSRLSRPESWAPFQTGFNAFQAFFENQQSQFVMKVRDKDEAAAGAPVLISSITRDPVDQAYYFLSFAPGPVFTAGSQIAVTGVRGTNIPRLNGYHTIRSFSAPGSAITLNTQAPPGAITINPGNFGKFQRLLFKFSPIVRLRFVSIANRKRGRALFVPRGRRPVVR